jgi:hypothetical protein
LGSLMMPPRGHAPVAEHPRDTGIANEALHRRHSTTRPLRRKPAKTKTMLNRRSGRADQRHHQRGEAAELPAEPAAGSKLCARGQACKDPP